MARTLVATPERGCPKCGSPKVEVRRYLFDQSGRVVKCDAAWHQRGT